MYIENLLMQLRECDPVSEIRVHQFTLTGHHHHHDEDAYDHDGDEYDYDDDNDDVNDNLA